MLPHIMQQRTRWGWLALPLAFAVWGMWRCWPYTLDDGFVFLRYADNLADGHGLVFNVGERVEGHSNTLWVLWLALGGVAGVPLLTWAKVSGAALLLATCVSGAWITRRLLKETHPHVNLDWSWVLGLLVSCALVLHPGAAYYAVSGMGTILTMWLGWLAAGGSALDLAADCPPESDDDADAPVAAREPSPAITSTHPAKRKSKRASRAGGRKRKKPRFKKNHRAKPHGAKTIAKASKATDHARAATADRAVPSRSKPHKADAPPRHRPRRWFFFALGALCVTRPEGPLVWFAICGIRILHWRRDGAALRREVVAAAVTLSPWLLLSGLRLAYYGHLLPNTYAAKPSTLFSHPAGAWHHLIDSFAALGWPLIVMLGGALGLASLQAKRARVTGRLRTRAAVVGLAAPVAAQLLFIVYSGGDWMPHGRFLIVVLPLAFSLAALGVAHVDDWKWLAVGFALAILWQGNGARRFWDELGGNQVHDHALRSDNNVVMAQWMRRHLPANKTVATDEIGAVGFYGGLHVHDMWGLVDREVAGMLQQRGFNPYNSPIHDPQRRPTLEAIAKTLLAREPDYILIDYRGPVPTADQPFSRRYFLPFTMMGFALHMNEPYRLRHVFPLMHDPPKTFLLFERMPVPSRP